MKSLQMKNISKYIIIIVTSFSLHSCFVAKDYSRPETMVEEQYYRTDSISQDSTSMADLSWKEMFTDPELISHIEEGLANNIDIRVAIENITISQAYLKQGKAGYLPTLTVGPNFVHQELSANGQLGAQFSSLDQYEVSADLSWEADIWGKIRSQKRAFDATYLQSVAAHQAVKTRLIADIASNYYQLLAVDEQMRITQETITTRENSLETTQALKDAGSLTEVAVKQTEAQLYNAQAILVDLKNQSRLLENALSYLLGKSPEAITRTSLEDQQITTALKVGVPALLLSNRPDVMAAEYNLVNAFELTNVARSNFYPSLTLSGSAGMQSLDFDKLFNANSFFASIASGLTQPLLNGRRIRTQYEIAEAQRNQAQLNFKEAILNASREVSDALYTYEANSETITIKEKEYDAYDKAVSYSEELLNYGLANYLEVLTARENALNANLSLINAKYNQLRAVVNLYEALGGGWK